MKKQSGSAHVAIIVILVVALLGALGFVFYQNVIEKNAAESINNEASSSNAQGNTDPETVDLKYSDLRMNKKDATGVSIQSRNDISKLPNISEDLRTYFSDNVGKQVDSMTGKVAQSFIVDRVFGSYAVGQSSSVSAYVIWGPKGDGGVIDVVAATQQLGFMCSDLKSASVPSLLVDEKCVSSGPDNEVIKYED